MDSEMKAYIREVTREKVGEMCACSLEAIRNRKDGYQKALMLRKDPLGLSTKVLEYRNNMMK